MKLLGLLFRIVASGAVSLAIGALLWLLCLPGFWRFYFVPGGIVGGSIILGLDSIPNVHSWLEENDFDASVAFAGVAAICGFVVWWAVTFAVWSYGRRPDKRYLLAVGATALGLLVPIGWIFVLLPVVVLYFFLDSVEGTVLAQCLVIGGILGFLIWMAAVVAVWIYFRRRNQYAAEVPITPGASS